MARGRGTDAWGSRLGIILAVSGSAVGLGNFLRFPGQAAANGGGAFMIPYFCALVFLGIPIGWAEWTMGRYGGRKGFHSSPAILGVVGRGAVARRLGVLAVLTPLAVSFYYTFIEAWCLAYTWKYLTGGLGIDPAAPVAEQTRVAASFFHASSGLDANGLLFGGSYAMLVFWGLAFAGNIALVYRGIARGIERFCSWAMPVMAVCALIVLVRVLTLGTPDPGLPEQNVLNGLGSIWNPDFHALANAQTWLAAAGQIFFTLSVGLGVILNYASYLEKQGDVVLSSLTAAATNEVFEVGFGGLITLTASFVFLGLSGTAAAVQTGAFGLGFNALPVVFAHMGSFGNAIGAIWFFMLFLAAITSSISMYQPSLAFFEEALGVTRRAATGLMVGICLVGSFLVIDFSRGGVFASAIDDWVGTFAVFVLATTQIVCFGWVLGIDRGWTEAHRGAQIRIPRPFRFIMKWVAPLYLLTVFVFFCKNNLPAWLRAVAAEPLRQGALALVLALLAFLLVCLRIGEKRWRAAGLDLDGERGVEE